MKIVPIFAQKLFAIQYEGEDENEYDRLLGLWGDTEYLVDFLLKNKRDIPDRRTLEEMANFLREDAFAIDDRLLEILEREDENLSFFFQPLHNQEYQTQVLSLQKGRRYYLRLYALKISEDIFLITGGAIKLTRTMQERRHTQKELDKLNAARDYLRDQDIFDEDSFFEFLIEEL